MMPPYNRTLMLLMSVVLLAVLAAAPIGCGNVTLRGDAMTAAEYSVADSLEACRRAEPLEGVPPWLKAYLAEDFVQWRHFVRSAKGRPDWGPLLPAERPPPAE